MEKQKNQLDFDKYFICPLCAYKIEWDELYAELLCDKLIPSGIKNSICEYLCDIEKVIEKMNHDTSLHTYYEEIKSNIEAIKNNTNFSDFMNFAPTLYRCEGCHQIIMLKEYEIIYPINDRIIPNKDLPDNIANNYKEALMNCHNSPTSFVAMIRTTMESLLKYINQNDKQSNLNDIINYLFENKKIDEITKEALHLIRKLGNTIHKDKVINMSYAQRIFLLEIINDLAEKFLTNRKQIEEIYSLLPEDAKRENREKILFDTYEYNDKCRFVLGNSGKNPLICIGINPSNATNQRSDPTIAKIQKIIQHNGYDGFMMINLCSKISPYPKDIPLKLVDCYHNDNLQHIENISKKYPNSDVLACWGNDFYMREYLPQILLDIVNKLGKYRKWFYLGDLTKKGNPRHPLYVAFDTRLKKFDIHSYITKN